MIADFLRGAKYFLDGFELIQQPGVRRYAVLPVLVNIILFAIGIYVLGNQYDVLMEEYLPDFEGYWVFLAWILWLVFGVLVLLVIFFTFTLLANLIGSPFNGPLAAAIEQKLEPMAASDNSNTSLIGDILSAVSGEMRKWVYYLFWAIPLMVLSLISLLIPVIAPLVSFLWLVFGAWLLAIEYLDYPMGNHQYTFIEIKNRLKQHRMLALGFGSAVMCLTVIPIINLVVMPAAVAAASKLWVREIKPFV